MTEGSFNFIWRCAKCSSHFSNITKMEGILKLEKKCPKCKSLNILTLTNREIMINCKLFSQETNAYYEDFSENFIGPN